jgi:hypothetical protein
MPDTLNANYVPMVLGILEPVVLQEVKRQAIIFALFVVYYCLLYWVPYAQVLFLPFIY